jgi:hypothetical protein
MSFLIQTINGEIKHDFSFTLAESCEYDKWLHPNDFLTFMTCDYVPDNHCNFVPIGTVEFVCDFLKKHYNLVPKPKNVPFELMDDKWTGRNVINGTEKDIIGEKFVKSNDVIKSFTEICKIAPVGNYQISDLIDIESEWRAFVYKGKLVGLHNYSGEFDVFPNVNRIKQMISAYESQPIAYTLDVAISNNNTVVIEVHDFFSCGLYGFSDHKILPYMFSNWFYSFIKK